MENGFVMIAAGILSGLCLSGVYAVVREMLRRQKTASEKAARMVIEIEAMLRERRCLMK